MIVKYYTEVVMELNFLGNLIQPVRKQDLPRMLMEK